MKIVSIMPDYYCNQCMQYRAVKFFSIWFEDRTKQRRCDFCSDKDFSARMIKNQAKERAIKREVGQAGLTQLQIKLSESDLSAEKVKTRRRIDEVTELMRINDEIGEF